MERHGGERAPLVVSLLLLAQLLAAGSCAPGASQGSDPGSVLARQSSPTATIAPVTLKDGERLRTVATTSIVADVVRNVGGDLLEVATLLPLGADPHAFDPTPRDVSSIVEAHVVFANGAGLEAFLGPMLESAGEDVRIVSLSENIELLAFGGTPSGVPDDKHDARAGADPHVWFDPRNVMVWSGNIAAALAAIDPVNAKTYEARARAYRAELEALDAWIAGEITKIAPENRRLVTDHTSLSYFASRYDFEQVGVVFPGYSTLAEPSARELAELETSIQTQQVKAIFVGLSANPVLADRIAEDTGTQLVFLYTGSLSEPGGPASDYISLMKFDVNAIVGALK